MDVFDEMILKRIFRLQGVNNYIHRITTKQEENNHIKHILGSYFINLFFFYTLSKLNNGKIIGLGDF